MERPRFTWIHVEHISVITGIVLVVSKAFSILFKTKSMTTYLLMQMAPEPSARKDPAVNTQQNSRGRKKLWHLKIKFIRKKENSLEHKIQH